MILDSYPYPLESEFRGAKSPEFMSCDFPYLQIMENLIVEKGYKDLLEIGAYKGHTSWLLSRLGNLTIVDPDPKLDPSSLSLHTMLKCKSQDVLPNLGKFDFVFVDGDHLFDACMFDVTESVKHLNPGGAVAIHDATFMPGVIAAMDELEKIWPEKHWEHYDLGKGMSILTP